MLCWTTWRIQPLSPRTRLIVKYTRCVTDNLRMTDKQASTTEINSLVKKLTGKLVKDQEDFSISPFCVTFPPPAVSCITLAFSTSFCIISTSFLSDYFFLNFTQITDSWWSSTPTTEGDDKEETPVDTEQNARAESDDGADEENQESSPEAPNVASKGLSTSDTTENDKLPLETETKQTYSTRHELLANIVSTHPTKILGRTIQRFDSIATFRHPCYQKEKGIKRSDAALKAEIGRAHV